MDIKCRHCLSSISEEIIDLGHQPPSNNYLRKDQLVSAENTYPLVAYICNKCGLVQLPNLIKANDLFTDNYAYFSSISSSWCKHSKNYVDKVVSELSLDGKSNVVEIASNDGYLLQYFKEKSIPCLGIEPTKATASVSINRGIETIVDFFDSKLAVSLEKADLIIANNVIAHVPDINDFVKGISILLKPEGYVSIEFPHLLNLVRMNQFDTIYHEHYSYISLTILQKIVKCYGMEVIHVEKLQTHGGSLRAWIRHSKKTSISKSVLEIFELEQSEMIDRYEAYKNLQPLAERVKIDLLRFLIECKDNNERIVGYGAAAKGNTLLNFAGVKSDLLEFVVDKAESKQDLYLPGSHIPVVNMEKFINYKPDTLLVLPWNLIKEIKEQEKEYKLVTAIPNLEFH